MAAPGAADQLERIRAICAALPESSERESHGHPAFFVGKRQVASFHDGLHGDGRMTMWCAAPEGAQEMLVDSAPETYFRPPYVGHRGWLGVYLDAGIGREELAGLIEDAFLTVATKTLIARYDGGA